MKLAALPPSPTRELCPVPPHLLSPGATDQVRSSRHTGKPSRASASGKLGPAPTLGAMLGGLGQATLPLWDPAALVCCGLTPGEGLPTAKQSHPVLQGQAGGPASTSQLCRSLSHDFGECFTSLSLGMPVCEVGEPRALRGLCRGRWGQARRGMPALTPAPPNR